jgi:CheY-like chemotaxis protein
MEKAQVLIVEDDGIIAMDLESRLKSFGYSVPGTNQLRSVPLLYA